VDDEQGVLGWEPELFGSWGGIGINGMPLVWQQIARHFNAGDETPLKPCAFSPYKPNVETSIMKKQVSIALAAGLMVMMAGFSAASATDMQQSLAPQSAYGRHNIYAGHNNSKGQQHAAFTALRDIPKHSVDID
jgi:hypothetical protein